MDSLEAHRKYHGKLFTGLRVPLDSVEDLKTFYTPGVADPCKEIAAEEQAAAVARGDGASGGAAGARHDALYAYTIKSNTVAVVSDGSAVLGLGDIGGAAALPVMEGKCALFKRFGDVDAFPICLDVQDADAIVAAVAAIAPVFGGINLEDIAAPKCFEVERRLQEMLDIPVFHDDQHGTAVVVLAGLFNALRVVKRVLADVKIAISGSGAAGLSIADLLLAAGATDIVVCDSKGVIFEGRDDMNSDKLSMARRINPRGVRGSLIDAMRDADVFIGVSRANVVSTEMIAAMATDPIVFAMANPIPELMPEVARAGGARVIATGRSDFPNQLNNVLVFPGIFRGALDRRVRTITIEMQLRAADYLARLVPEPTAERIIPSVFEDGVSTAVAQAIF